MEETEAKAKPVLPTQPINKLQPPDPRAEEWASRK